jgi:hypothetical protein
MKTGDKVWIFDSNRRIYRDNEGNKIDSPFYRSHFVERYIVGETKQSWLIGYETSSPTDRTVLRVNKKNMIVKGHALGQHLYLSEDEIDKECWLHENKYRIIESLRYVHNYELFKAIDELLMK